MGSIGGVSRTASDAELLGQNPFRLSRPDAIAIDQRGLSVGDLARRGLARGAVRPMRPPRPASYGQVRGVPTQSILGSQRGRHLDVFA
ncbi:MAG: hypothetical protein HY722_06005 [Planctomycetes bacterium]|nr:hypothetical protein [Planctomycetota bacterium]